MSLSPNSRLGPYEIKSTLGVGGVGEVYRARDSRLNRQVAIKILREDAAATPDLKARFEREAHAVAALNHPNIVAVFDFGVDEQDGGHAQYIVSELIEGESLRSVIAGKPVLIRKLMDIAVQIADGLAAAHAVGIIHRDLKPENIMLTRDGRVKLLDFGLARQSARSPLAARDSDETIALGNQDKLTGAGAILGTANYMSPEQARGQELDHRSDQFSFGLILHEMATGKQAFSRGSSVETMAAIVLEEPPAIQSKLPAPLRWTIDRCLAKEPEQRYESTRDLHKDLHNLSEHFSEVYSSSGALAPLRTNAQLGYWILAGACLLLCGLTAFLFLSTGQNIAKYQYTPLAADANNAVWSPDGKAFAYAAAVNGVDQTFLRYLNSPVPFQLTHEKRDVLPMGWSNDRDHLIVWEPANTRELPSRRLYAVATVGGELEFIMDLDCEACDLSRDGKALGTVSKGEDGIYNVFVSDPLGSPLRAYSPAPFSSKSLFGETEIAFSPDGSKILLIRKGENVQNEAWLLPYPLLADQRRPPKRVLGDLPMIGIPSFSWMPDNRHVVIFLHKHLWIADTELSRLDPLTTGNSNEQYPVVSPDGERLIYRQGLFRFDVVSVSVEDGSASTLITTGPNEGDATWAPNVAKLAWITERDGPREIWVRLPDGSERPVVTRAEFPIGKQENNFTNPTLSPDGERLIYRRVGDSGSRLWISSLSGGPPVRLTNAEPSTERCGSWSPDGTRFVYVHVERGKKSLMIAKTSGNTTPIQLKENVELYLPEWSPTGNWITYRDEKGWNLISPDGKSSRFLAAIETSYFAFSKDGKLLYGIQTGETEADQDRATLFSLDPVTRTRKDIKELGKDFIPRSNFFPGIRFSLAPDGKSLVYSVSHGRWDLWMLQGYRQPGLWNRIKDAFHFGKPN